MVSNVPNHKTTPNARTRLIVDGKIFRLIVYSYTARKIMGLLYENCVVALDRKLEKVREQELSCVSEIRLQL